MQTPHRKARSILCSTIYDTVPILRFSQSHDDHDNTFIGYSYTKQRINLKNVVDDSKAGRSIVFHRSAILIKMSSWNLELFV